MVHDGASCILLCFGSVFICKRSMLYTVHHISYRYSIFCGDKLPNSGSHFGGTGLAVDEKLAMTTILLYVVLWP